MLFDFQQLIIIDIGALLNLNYIRERFLQIQKYNQILVLKLFFLTKKNFKNIIYKFSLNLSDRINIKNKLIQKNFSFQFIKRLNYYFFFTKFFINTKKQEKAYNKFFLKFFYNVYFFFKFLLKRQLFLYKYCIYLNQRFNKLKQKIKRFQLYNLKKQNLINIIKVFLFYFSFNLILFIKQLIKFKLNFQLQLCLQKIKIKYNKYKIFFRFYYKLYKKYIKLKKIQKKNKKEKKLYKKKFNKFKKINSFFINKKKKNF